jgi:hypothetical protein
VNTNGSSSNHSSRLVARAANPSPEASGGVHLITSLYNEPSPTRIAELLTCLERNLANRGIASVDVFFDDSRPLETKVLLERLRTLPVSLEMIEGRPTYRQLFEYANAKWPNSTVAVANADIYFDDTLELLRHVSLDEAILALTRWNVLADGTAQLLVLADGFPNYFSADTWIFNTPLELDFYCEYELGTMFCDSFLNGRLFESSLSVVNPCLELKTYHLQAEESLSQQFEKDDTVEQKRAMWRAEYARNGNRDPMRGVVWSTLAGVRRGSSSREFRWRPRHVVVRPDPANPLGTRSLTRLMRVADDFNRNLWVVRDGLDAATLAFIEDVANTTINLVDAYDSAPAITKEADQDLVELLRAHPERDVFVPSEALDEPPATTGSPAKRRALTRQPRISVITPVFNGARYIEGAIHSVLRQRYPNVEHLVIDGGSTDGTPAILQRYDHLAWLSAPDDGQAAAMNFGFELATGEMIVYLNADDYFLPGAFESVVSPLAAGADIVFGKIKVLNQDGSVWINSARTAHVDVLRHWEPDAFCVNPVGYFYRREVQEHVGGFNEANHLSMDLEFLMACSQSFMFSKVDRVLGVFRYLDGTKTRASAHDDRLWTPDSFPYVDGFVRLLHDEFREEYEPAREAGYAQKEEWRRTGLATVSQGTSGQGHEWGYGD